MREGGGGGGGERELSGVSLPCRIGSYEFLKRGSESKLPGFFPHSKFKLRLVRFDPIRSSQQQIKYLSPEDALKPTAQQLTP